MVILLMGVAGAGKTTVGRALADQLHWQFADADDFHCTANVAKMSTGIPLTDADRVPWLQSLHTAIVACLEAKDNVVLACSALKGSYRDELLVSFEVKLVYLRANEKLIVARMAQRTGHYMSPQLLRSQFETLEEPQDALTVEAGLTVDEIVHKIRSALAL